VDGSVPGGSALVLTGGGNCGAIRAGALLALSQQDHRPDHTIGVSVGAINGAMLSFYPTTGGLYRVFDIWRILDGAVLFGPRSLIWRGLAAHSLRRPAAFSSRRPHDLLAQYLPSRRFSDTAIPFLAVATNLGNGRATCVIDSDLIGAIFASVAGRLHLPAVRTGGRYGTALSVVTKDQPAPGDISLRPHVD